MAEAISMDAVKNLSSLPGKSVEIFEPIKAPQAPERPTVSPILIFMFPSRKWLNAPESVVNIMAASEVPTAVWIGILKTSVNTAMTTPAPARSDKTDQATHGQHGDKNQHRISLRPFRLIRHRFPDWANRHDS